MQPPCFEMADGLQCGDSRSRLSAVRSTALLVVAPPDQGELAVIKWNFMFARKISVEYQDNGSRIPCPLKWLDSFSMRNFTNASVFDDTLPLADGRMEIGSSVPMDQLKDAMEDWFRRKGYLRKDSQLLLSED
jgi:hypothetical protein